LVEALLLQGQEVVCVDDLSIGCGQENLLAIPDRANLSFVEMDVTDADALREVFRSGRFDCVCHLAANSDIQASAKDPQIEYRNTYTTTFCLLECMRTFDVKRLFFASTSAVYGEKEGEAVGEGAADLRPISYYGAAKLGSEALIHAYSYMDGLDALIYRFPNVVGSRLTHGAIFDFVRRLKDDPSQLTILGDGSQVKPYMHVSDLVGGILQGMDGLAAGGGVSIYNIGVETQTPVWRIGELVLEGMGLAGIPVHFTGGRGGWRGDVPAFAYDLSKIHATGWRASMTSDEAVARTVCEVLA
jgi:UDP-glucose 4-epimerase